MSWRIHPELSWFKEQYKAMDSASQLFHPSWEKGFPTFSMKFHYPVRLHSPSILFLKYLNCCCHVFLFLILLLSRKSQCSSLTYSPVSWKRRQSYWCLLQLWTQMEFMAFGVVFITVLKAQQMPSKKTPVRVFLPQAPHTLWLLWHPRQGSSRWCELLLL